MHPVKIAWHRLVRCAHDRANAGQRGRASARLSRGLVATLAGAVLLGFGAAPAFAWDARTTEGTSRERAYTTTPLPPGGDQCSLGAPDSVRGLYDFSWACYAHDVCYQNHALNGRNRSRGDCDAILLTKARAECDSRHNRWNPKRYACRDIATYYWEGVRVAGTWSWNSCNPRAPNCPNR